MARRRYTRRASPRRYARRIYAGARARYRRRTGKTIGIASTVAAINYPAQLVFRQGAHGIPLYEAQAGNYQNVMPAIMDNMKWSLTTIEGISETLVPIMLTQIFGRFFNKTIVRVKGWTVKAI